MPTHCLLKTKQHLEAQGVEKAIKDIVYNKFDNILNVIPHISNNLCWWDVKYDDVYCFPIYLRSSEQIDFIHPDNLFAYWTELVIEEQLAQKYNGQLFDEEYPNQKLPGLCGQHQTFRQFLETTLHHSSSWKQAVILIELSRLPEPLKKF